MEALIITIEHDFAHAPHQLWRAWTEPDLLKAWAWGVGRKTRASNNLVRGGRWEVYGHFPEQREQWRSEWMGQLGMYLEIAPQERLVFTTHWDANVGYNTVEVPPAIDEVICLDFSPSERGCLMRYEHLGVPERKSADVHEQSMRAGFAELDAKLQTMLIGEA